VIIAAKPVHDSHATSEVARLEPSMTLLDLGDRMATHHRGLFVPQLAQSVVVILLFNKRVRKKP
jgi:phage-related protein